MDSKLNSGLHIAFIFYALQWSKKNIYSLLNPLLLLLRISNFSIILTIIESQSQLYQSQLYQSQLLLQLISIYNFQPILPTPNRSLSSSFQLPYNPNHSKPFWLFSTVPYLMYTLLLNQVQSQHCKHWLIVVWNSYSLGFHIYKIWKKCLMLLLTFYIMHHFYDKWQLANKIWWFKNTLLFYKQFLYQFYIHHAIIPG